MSSRGINIKGGVSMDEKKVYSLIVVLVCFVLMALIVIGAAIYQWINGLDDVATQVPEQPAIVETNSAS